VKFLFGALPRLTKKTSSLISFREKFLPATSSLVTDRAFCAKQRNNQNTSVFYIAKLFKKHNTLRKLNGLSHESAMFEFPAGCNVDSPRTFNDLSLCNSFENLIYHVI